MVSLFYVKFAQFKISSFTLRDCLIYYLKNTIHFYIHETTVWTGI